MNEKDINIKKQTEDNMNNSVKDNEKDTENKSCNSENNENENTEKVSTSENIENIEEELKQLKDSYLRKIAEFENYKKRTLKEKTELILNGSEKTITAILPVLDDFERAITDKSDDPKAIKEGIQLI